MELASPPGETWLPTTSPVTLISGLSTRRLRVRLDCGPVVSDRTAAGPTAARAAARSAASSSVGSAASPPSARNPATKRSSESTRCRSCRSCIRIESCRVGCWAAAGAISNTNPSKHPENSSFRKPTSKPVSSVPVARSNEKSNASLCGYVVTGWGVLFRRYRKGCSAGGRCIGCRLALPSGDTL